MNIKWPSFKNHEKRLKYALVVLALIFGVLVAAAAWKINREINSDVAMPEMPAGKEEKATIEDRLKELDSLRKNSSGGDETKASREERLKELESLRKK
jgi:Skp family chaperone for outer membrane proteins